MLLLESRARQMHGWASDSRRRSADVNYDVVACCSLQVFATACLNNSALEKHGFAGSPASPHLTCWGALSHAVRAWLACKSLNLEYWAILSSKTALQTHHK